MVLLKESLIELEGKVWKVFPDSSTKTLLIEERKEHERFVCFHCLSYKDLTWNWRSFTPEEDWWAHLLFAGQNRYIIGYQEEAPIPRNKGFELRSVVDNKLIFKSDQELFEECNPPTFQTSHKNPHLSGSKNRFRQLESGTLTKNVIKPLRNLSNYYLPTVYNPESQYHKSVAAFIYDKLGLQPLKQLYYLQESEWLVIGFFSSTGQEMQQHLTIWNKCNGTLIKQVLLQENIKGISEIPFFIIKDTLVAIGIHKIWVMHVN